MNKTDITLNKREELGRERRMESGDGSKESPFLMPMTHVLLSTGAQKSTLNYIWGEGSYAADGLRKYHTSSLGEPQNQDLCEHVIAHNTGLISVWFDLSNVTALMTDPKYQDRLAELEAKIEGITSMAAKSQAGLNIETRSAGCMIGLLLAISGFGASMLIL
jgi:hypothetical protein